MKAIKYWGLTAALFLVILAGPSTVRADSLVAVTVANLTFPCYYGFNLPPSCAQTLDAVFLWDNTSNNYVANSLFFSTFGPLGSSLTAAPNGSGFDFSTLPSNPVAATIIFIMGSTSPGSYSLGTDMLFVPPDTAFSALVCNNSACAGFYATNGTLGQGTGPFKGAWPSTGSVNVYGIPEPSSLLLLCTGLFGLVALIRQRVGCLDNLR